MNIACPLAMPVLFHCSLVLSQSNEAVFVITFATQVTLHLGRDTTPRCLPDRPHFRSDLISIRNK